MNAKNVAMMLAVAVGLASGVAWGQVQQIQQGHALDANNQVGSGGSNQPVQGYTPVNGNDVVSGNVAGLKYFHGNVEVHNPYQFEGTLGSASLSGFARQSAGNGPGAYSSGLNSSYYNPSSQVSRGAGGFNPGMVGNGWDSRYVPQTAVSPMAAAPVMNSGPMAAGVPFRAYDRLNAGANSAQLPSDLPGGALSSPLFALRVNTPSAAIDGTVKNGKATQKNGGEETRPDAEPPSKEPANNINSDLITAKIPGTDRIRGQVVATTVEPEPADMRVSEKYRGLLEELKKSQEGAGEATNKVAMNGVPGTPGKEATAKAPGTDNAHMPRLEIDPLTGQPREVKDPKALAKQGYQTENPALPGYVSKGALESMEPRPTKVLAAGKTVKPLRSFSGGTATPFDELAKKAEDLLKNGRYFEAAEAYQSALVAEPNNALGILGRAHAELAAGMYESSAWDLKYVFERKPEMTSVRYELGDFLPQSRQEFLHKDLLALAQKKGGGDTASFLLCYLCYQTGRNDELSAELERWALRNDKDPWLDVAKRAWGK